MVELKVTKSVSEEYFEVAEILDEVEEELQSMEDSGKDGSFREGAGFILRLLGVNMVEQLFGDNCYSLCVTVYAEEDPHALDPIPEVLLSDD